VQSSVGAADVVLVVLEEEVVVVVPPVPLVVVVEPPVPPELVELELQPVRAARKPAESRRIVVRIIRRSLLAERVR
jgi:hypothetical protein